MLITISDGSTTSTVSASDIEAVTFDPEEFDSSYEATWYFVETDTEVLVADIRHTDHTDFERLQTIADSDYLVSNATNDYP